MVEMPPIHHAAYMYTKSNSLLTSNDVFDSHSSAYLKKTSDIHPLPTPIVKCILFFIHSSPFPSLPFPSLSFTLAMESKLSPKNQTVKSIQLASQFKSTMPTYLTHTKSSDLRKSTTQNRSIHPPSLILVLNVDVISNFLREERQIGNETKSPSYAKLRCTLPSQSSILLLQFKLFRQRVLSTSEFLRFFPIGFLFA